MKIYKYKCTVTVVDMFLKYYYQLNLYCYFKYSRRLKKGIESFLLLAETILFHCCNLLVFLSGYTGHNCETNIDNCFPGACINSTCVDGDDTYSCLCYDGYTGNS